MKGGKSSGDAVGASIEVLVPVVTCGQCMDAECLEKVILRQKEHDFKETTSLGWHQTLHPFIGLKEPGVSPRVGRLTISNYPFGFTRPLRECATLNQVRESDEESKIAEQSRNESEDTENNLVLDRISSASVKGLKEPVKEVHWAHNQYQGLDIANWYTTVSVPDANDTIGMSECSKETVQKKVKEGKLSWECPHQINWRTVGLKSEMRETELKLAEIAQQMHFPTSPEILKN